MLLPPPSVWWSPRRSLSQVQKRQVIVCAANCNANLSCSFGTCTISGGWCYAFVNDQVRVAISQAGTPMASRFMNDLATVIPPKIVRVLVGRHLISISPFKVLAPRHPVRLFQVRLLRSTSTSGRMAVAHMGYTR